MTTSTINKKYKNVIPKLYKNSELIEFSKKIDKITKLKDYEILYRKKNSKKFLPINKVFFNETGVDFCFAYGDNIIDDSGDIFYFYNDKIMELEDEKIITINQLINRFRINYKPLKDDKVDVFSNHNLQLLGI